MDTPNHDAHDWEAPSEKRYDNDNSESDALAIQAGSLESIAEVYNIPSPNRPPQHGDTTQPQTQNTSGSELQKTKAFAYYAESFNSLPVLPNQHPRVEQVGRGLLF